MDVVLTAVEVRVLGSLLEKERTVPATYPLTMKALVAACNQSSSRDPLMDVSEAEVDAAVEGLKAHKLVRKVLATTGTRATKYRQVAQEALTVDDAQRAVLTVLLLRGPQTPQELRTRAERLHPFGDAEVVRETLVDMAGWGDPLVAELPRRRGQRDTRWAHRLAGEPSEPEVAEPTSVAPVPPTGPAVPAPDPVLHGELVALVGTWVGPGDGHYPTIAGFSYAEQIEVTPVPGKPLLAYRSVTSAADDGRGLHAESGFFRLTGDGGVELVVAAGPGIVEACAGIVERTATGVGVELASEAVAGTPSAKVVTATERSYRVEGDVLTYDVSMAAVGHPVAHHLRATLRRR
ncbi:DUF480 domain-containing protein [Iamia sp.]|uniref:DUF480 domain-containing protein n=1 Tax=Iamia sp. TaxID=2722710 RepID=UPI002CC9CB4E|nr:DUF480 domain-containing protein [Iamia sp.]HXH58225.1 DUF480 domain-containing protein [Iamia sp.]